MDLAVIVVTAIDKLPFLLGALLGVVFVAANPQKEANLGWDYQNGQVVPKIQESSRTLPKGGRQRKRFRAESLRHALSKRRGRAERFKESSRALSKSGRPRRRYGAEQISARSIKAGRACRKIWGKQQNFTKKRPTREMLSRRIVSACSIKAGKACRKKRSKESSRTLPKSGRPRKRYSTG